jgi:UDP-glucose 4-epimerase
MKVLVTGGAGYIGSHTVQKLLDAGHEPVIYDNLSTGFKEAIPAGVKFIHGDVRESDLLHRTMKEHPIEAVIHFAAKLIVPESVEKPLEYYDNNVNGTLRVLEACGKNKVSKFIFSSTAAVYGNPEKSPVTEDMMPAPINPYGSSKWMSEKILADYAKVGGPNYVILRYFNVAGAAVKGGNGQRTKNATHLVKVASEVAAKKRLHIEIYGKDYATSDGTCVRDYIHVEDLAMAHLQALNYLSHGGVSQIFNAGYGVGYSVRDVVQTMIKVSKTDFTIKEGPRRAGDPDSIVADSTKIQKTMGWKPQYNDIELICKTAYDWEKSL